jgi:hypothetical protein
MTKRKESKTVAGVRLDTELRNWLEAKAAKERRTLSNLIQALLWQSKENEEHERTYQN